MHSVEFFLREAWLNIRRSGLTGVTATTTVLVSLCILGSFGLLVLNLDLMAHRQAERLDVQVYLKEGLAPAKQRHLHRQILHARHVVDAQFISKNAALRELQAELPNLDLSYLTRRSRNPLPESFRIRVSPVSEIPALAQSWTRLPVVDQVIYSDVVWRQLTAWSRILKAMMVAAGLALTLGVLIIISNTIRLTIYARRRDIRVMQLVGATNWFIRVPFLLEGAFYGMAGAVAACAVLAPVYSYAVSYVQSAFGAYYVPNLVTDLGTLFRFHGGVLLVGLLFGLTGSGLSMRRYVRAI